MNTDNKNLGKYLGLIKRVVDWKIRDPAHHDIKQDVVQEAFIKLFNIDFFDHHNFDDEQSQKMIAGYVSRTVHSCYMDQLKKLGYNRRLTKAERERKGKKYENVVMEEIGDAVDQEKSLSQKDTPELYISVMEAYQRIKHCYELTSAKISNLNKRRFFHAAFWRLDDHAIPINKLAEILEYSSANPTRDLKHFTAKVSRCTEPHGVRVTNASEQIQFLVEQIDSSRAMS